VNVTDKPDLLKVMFASFS